MLDQVLEHLELRLLALQQQKLAPDSLFYFALFSKEYCKSVDFDAKVLGEALFSVGVIAQHVIVAHVLYFVGLH